MQTIDVERRIYIVSVAVFIVMLGVGIVAPILPMYARSFGTSYLVVGLTVSVFGLARMLSDIPSGSFSDRFGRRPIVIAGILLFSLAGIVAAYATNVEHLILARFVQGVGAAMFTTSAMAYVADLAPIEKRGRYLGHYQGSFSLGSATGPAIGGLVAWIGGIRMPFLALSALSLVAAGFSYRSIRSAVSSASQQPAREINLRHAISHTLSSRAAILANLSALVTFLTMTSVRFTAIPIFGTSTLGLEEFHIGAILSVSALANFVVIRWAGALVDKIGGFSSLLYGFLFTGAVVTLFPFARDFNSMLIMGAMFGLSTSIVMPAQATLAVGASDKEHRGLSLGINRLFSDTGMILGPIMTGILSDLLSVNMPFYAVAGICVTTALGIFVVRRAEEFSSDKKSDQ